MEHVMTVPDAAKRLGVTRRTIYNWIRDGRLPAARVSPRTTRVPAAAVEALAGDTAASAATDLSSILWDVDPSRVDLQTHARFVIRRILEAGRPEQVAWMLGRYELEQILDVAEHDRALPHAVAVAWSELLRRRRDRTA